MDYKRFSYKDVLLVFILTMLCLLFYYVPVLGETVIGSILGLVIIIFLPGYMLIAYLFPRKNDLDLIERATLTLIFSVVITALSGLILNYLPFGIHVETMLLSLVTITLVLTALTLWRRSRISYEEHLRYDFQSPFKKFSSRFSQESKSGKFLSVIVVVSLVLALSSTAYVIAKPKQEASYAQFYILGPDGKLNNYPTSLISGQQGNLIIGVVNNENKDTKYRLLVTSDGAAQIDETLDLNANQKMEIPFNFSSGDPGSRKLEFFLYKLPDNENAYRYLYLWINITNNPGTG